MILVTVTGKSRAFSCKEAQRAQPERGARFADAAHAHRRRNVHLLILRQQKFYCCQVIRSTHKGRDVTDWQIIWGA